MARPRPGWDACGTFEGPHRGANKTHARPYEPRRVPSVSRACPIETQPRRERGRFGEEHPSQLRTESGTRWASPTESSKSARHSRYPKPKTVRSESSALSCPSQQKAEHGRLVGAF